MRIPVALFLAMIPLIRASGASVATVRKGNQPVSFEPWRVSGHHGLLSSGMRVDALFWAKGLNEEVEIPAGCC